MSAKNDEVYHLVYIFDVFLNNSSTVWEDQDNCFHVNNFKSFLLIKHGNEIC